MLKSLWLQISKNKSFTDVYYKELIQTYSRPSRYYHNLLHLEEMFGLLNEFYKNKIPETTIWAVFYHDFIYNPILKNNEEKSAVYAVEVMQLIGKSENETSIVRNLIETTSTHKSNNNDLDLSIFLDADMAILGAPELRYKEYAMSVRKEYNIVPEVMYNRGRSAFLEKYVGEKIFLTEWFENKFGKQAQENIKWELKTLR